MCLIERSCRSLSRRAQYAPALCRSVVDNNDKEQGEEGSKTLRCMLYCGLYTLPLQKAGGIWEDRWKTTRFRSGSAAVVLALSDVVNAGFVLSTATLEMTPSLSMVSTLSDLPSTLCGPE
ncbi:hypothetical protein T02_13934 [Trichinella nativa]|uniref:Uncharacterized protein n=1 Tax=Trichinella nativa TaxID=6335 RepID=A0A0V1KM92_9BILA|nr:hypothetical protein T02_13934 [Trichinella nativa]